MQNPLRLPSGDQNRIREVTVFFDQAYVKREARTQVEPGLNRILIEVTAYQVDQDSVQAQVFGEGQLLSVQLREIPVKEAPQKTIRELDEAKRGLQRRKQRLLNAREVVDKQKQFLDSTLRYADVEVTREIARRFNRLYGSVFPVPKTLLGDVPTLVGIDGQAKMSKSLKNAIYLSDDAQTVEHKVMSMFTDPNRVRADIPGQVENNPVFIYHDAFNPDQDEVSDLKDRYRRGKVGDVEVKTKLARALNAMLEPIRERRVYFETRPRLVEDILVEGNRRMRVEAVNTMALVRDAMGLYRTPEQELAEPISATVSSMLGA